ncbi:unnamed protein product [Didymodactylos carnosus]|uniref:NAD(P)(+)--arginine ADP-ribosyltransferase n=1 Tax=Didymodactylos carnosus TaxID=1234261 RepID=A0A814PSZ2_9BILA|nr:unnamed protein product [Didymodactylos carnosus]CAF3874605.1 unnamed protein product [Didymodactylos carnosus]
MSDTGRIQWYRRETSNYKREAWTPYSDIENDIIEDAHMKHGSQVELDDYSIELKRAIQISKEDKSNETAIKRLTNIPHCQQLRQERFFSSEPMTINVKTFSEQGYGSKFIRQWLYINNIAFYDLITNESIAGRVAQVAVWGILTEAAKLGRRIEARWMCNSLENAIGKSTTEIGQCCVHLYTRDSFLYRLVNRTLLDGGNRTKRDTLAPYCALLAAYLRRCCLIKDTIFSQLNDTSSSSSSSVVVYRGADLSPEQTEAYKNGIGKRFSWPSFSSTSKRREAAELFGNTLFVINLKSISIKTNDCMADIQQYSQFPEEEETLLAAGINFKIWSAEHNLNGKFIIKVSVGRLLSDIDLDDDEKCDDTSL